MRRFLDVGTGSGILSVAAAKLWPEATGIALDIDPGSVSQAVENLVRNGVDHRVEASETDVAQIASEPGFELVVANIQADVLLALRDVLVARVAAGGWLILSGLLTEQVEEVVESYAQAGLARVRTLQLPDDAAWGAAVLRRP